MACPTGPNANISETRDECFCIFVVVKEASMTTGRSGKHQDDSRILTFVTALLRESCAHFYLDWNGPNNERVVEGKYRPRSDGWAFQLGCVCSCTSALRVIINNGHKTYVFCCLTSFPGPPPGASSSQHAGRSGDLPSRSVRAELTTAWLSSPPVPVSPSPWQQAGPPPDIHSAT